jgi:hypothetical protein
MTGIDLRGNSAGVNICGLESEALNRGEAIESACIVEIGVSF